MRKLAVMLTAAFVVGGIVAATQARPAEETIEKVMKTAMAKNGLLSKVSGGTATADQKKELLKLYKDLAGATPPRGDKASWKAKTDVLVTAAQAAVDGKADAADQLKKAANCKACHSAHRGG